MDPAATSRIPEEYWQYRELFEPDAKTYCPLPLDFNKLCAMHLGDLRS